VLLCSVCDGKVHSDLPLHDREVWTGSYFTPIPPTVTIDPESLQVTTISKAFNFIISWCVTCHCQFCNLYEIDIAIGKVCVYDR